jgi:hypothetical protein
MKKLLHIFWIFFILNVNALAASYYIDLDYTGTESGTCAEPYNSLLDVDADFLSAGDLVYIKAGSTGTLAQEAVFTSDGSDAGANDITIGTYTWSAGPTCTPDAVGAAITRPIIDNTGSTSSIWLRGSYYHIYNLHLTDGTDIIRLQGFAANESNVIIEYVTIEGVSDEVGGQCIAAYESDSYDYDNVTVRYITCNGNSQTDETSNDCIFLGYKSDNAVVQYNTLYNCDHNGVGVEGDNFLVENNYIYDVNGHLDTGIGIGPREDQATQSGNGGIIRYNYIDGSGLFSGIQVTGSGDNKIHHNIIFGVRSNEWQAAIYFIGFEDDELDGSLAYNNSIYDVDNDSRCIAFACGATVTQCISSGIEVKNNICHTGGGAVYPPFQLVDSSATADPSAIAWENNIAYNWSSTYYAEIEANDYSLAGFNALGNVSGNLDTDPGMADPVNDDFTLSSGSAIDGGTSAPGATYDDGWDPDSSLPPTAISKLAQIGPWDIGAYVFDLLISNISPSDGGVGVSIDADLSWTNPTGAITVNVYFDEDEVSCPPGAPTQVATGSLDTSYDPGTMGFEKLCCWRVDVVHAGGTATGNNLSFTTTDGPPPAATSKLTGVYDDQGVVVTYDDQGVVGR